MKQKGPIMFETRRSEIRLRLRLCLNWFNVNQGPDYSTIGVSSADVLDKKRLQPSEHYSRCVFVTTVARLLFLSLLLLLR